jgi:hypothetical protein
MPELQPPGVPEPVMYSKPYGSVLYAVLISAHDCKVRHFRPWRASIYSKSVECTLWPAVQAMHESQIDALRLHSSSYGGSRA